MRRLVIDRATGRPTNDVNLYQATETNPPSLISYQTLPNRDRAYDALPGLAHGSRPIELLKEDVVNGFQALFPASEETDQGILQPGFPDTITQLRCCMGYPAWPLGIPPTDNEKFKDAYAQIVPESAALQRHLDPRDLELYDWILEIMIPDNITTWRSIPIRATASYGLPDMAKDIPLKVALNEPYLRTPALVAEMVCKGQMYDLFEKTRQMFSYTSGLRLQAQSVRVVDGKPKTKARMAMDIDEHWVEQDFTLEGPAQITGLQTRCRPRKINAASGAPLLPLRAVARAIEFSLHSVACFSFTNRMMLTDEFSTFPYLEMGDVTNHDVQVPIEMVDILARRIGKVFGPYLGYLCYLAFHMPLLAKHDGEGKAGTRLFGDPFKVETFNLRYGNPSGIPVTSVGAKAFGVFYDLQCLRDCGVIGHSREEVHRVMHGHHPRCLLKAAGDNYLIGLKEKNFKGRISDRCKYAMMTISQTIYGLLRVIDHRNTGIFMPNPFGPVQRMLANGRSLDDTERGHWAFGWFEGKQIAEGHTSYTKVHDAFNDICQSHLMESMDDLARRHYIQPPAGASRSVYDTMFRLNPDIIHYMIDPDQVSPEVLAEIFYTIPVQDFMPMMDVLKNIPSSAVPWY